MEIIRLSTRLLEILSSGDLRRVLFSHRVNVVRLLGLLLGLLVFVQYALLPPAALAAGNAYTPDATISGDVKAEAPVNKIGALLLADATAFLNSGTMEVHGKGPEGSNQTLLTGTVLNEQVNGTGANRIIRGICYFTGGTSLSALCTKSGRADRVKTTNGDVLEGAISAVGADGLTVQTASGAQRVAANSIQCLDSSCAFEFELSHGSKMKFGKCTVQMAAVKTTRVSTAATTTTTHSRAVKIFVALLLVAGIATAIAVPIAVSHHHHRNNNQANLIAQQILLKQRSSSMSSQVSSVISNPFSSSSSSGP